MKIGGLCTRACYKDEKSLSTTAALAFQPYIPLPGTYPTIREELS